METGDTQTPPPEGRVTQTDANGGLRIGPLPGDCEGEGVVLGPWPAPPPAHIRKTFLGEK